MELLFRKYFWTINLLFIALVGWIVARTANIFVEAKVAPVTTAQPARAAQKPRASDPVAQLQMEKLARLTGLPIPEPEPEVKEPEQAVADLSADPVKSGLRVKLLGTLLASQQEWSIASIQDTVTNISSTYMVGDRIQNAEIIEIERKRVIVINNGRKEFIDDQAGSGEAIAAMPAMPAAQVAKAPGPKSNLGEGIRALNDNEYEVPRTEIDKTLSNLNDIAMQARIVPAFKDGVAQGFKLFSIRPDSIYSKIGVQNGDVIKRINGFDLNSPEKALEVYSKLKEANRVDLELERNGSTIRKTYTIR